MRFWRSRRTGTIPLGTYRYSLLPRTLSLSGEEVQSHIHVQGRTGSGKSRWLAGFYVNLLKAGYSATLIDPHGDLARLVLSQLVADGYFDEEGSYDKLLYLDIPGAASRNRYLRFNCLKQPYDTHTTTRLMLEALRRAFPSLSANGSHASPAFEQIVTAGVHVLIENGLPFPMLRPLLLPRLKEWRDGLLQRVPDRMIQSFFHDEFDQWDTKLRDTLEGSTLRRLFLLLYNPVLRYALAAHDNVLNYRSIIQQNRSLIVNLAVNDPDSKHLLGCLMTVFAEQGAKSRSDLRKEERAGTHFIILDEFQTFVAQSREALSDMLSQTRKFNTFVVLSHQTREQIPEDMRSGLQNVEVDVTFRTGREDAEHQAKVVGKIDPLAVKHLVTNEEAAKRSHPAFYSLPEQWEHWTEQIVRLPKRVAFVKHPNGSVTKVRSPHMPDPVCDPGKLSAVEEHYLRTCFTTSRGIEPDEQAEEMTIWERERAVTPLRRWIELTD